MPASSGTPARATPPVMTIRWGLKKLTSAASTVPIVRPARRTSSSAWPSPSAARSTTSRVGVTGRPAARAPRARAPPAPAPAPLAARRPLDDLAGRRDRQTGGLRVAQQRTTAGDRLEAVDLAAPADDLASAGGGGGGVAGGARGCL